MKRSLTGAFSISSFARENTKKCMNPLPTASCTIFKQGVYEHIRHRAAPRPPRPRLQRRAMILRATTFALGLELLLPFTLRSADWPQFRGPNRDSVWNEGGILQTFPTEG